MIIGKRPHPRWSRFMLLDYPTPSDMHRYQQLHLAGQIPRGGNGYHPGIGGDIGIHGSDHETLNRTKVNWTLGCISLFNHDMRELYASAPVGTFVYIKN
jgi:lipoprotein-anchoring transpeptidase ErfK/SrfK